MDATPKQIHMGVLQLVTPVVVDAKSNTTKRASPTRLGHGRGKVHNADW
jgi:hypothetical protein